MPLCRAQQYEEARAPGGRVGEGRVVQREHELQHVAAIEEGVIEARAQPLLEQAIVLSREVTPLLKELNEGDIMGNLEKLTSSAAVAVADIARINEHVLTPDNLELLKDSVSTLVKTLKHIEDISDNVSDMVGDNSTQANIKQLIQSLSRILVD